MKLFNFSINNDFGPLVKFLSLFFGLWLIIKFILKVLGFPILLFKNFKKKRFPNPMEF